MLHVSSDCFPEKVGGVAGSNKNCLSRNMTITDKVFWFTTTDSIIATAFGRPYGSVREGIMSPYHFYEILLQLRSGYDRGATILFRDGSGLSDS